MSKDERKHAKNIQKMEKQFSASPSPNGALQLAELYKSDGKIEQAIAILRESLEIFPDHATILIALSRILIAAEPDEDTIEEIKDAMASVLRKAPGNFAAEKILQQASDLNQENKNAPSIAIGLPESPEDGKSQKMIEDLGKAYAHLENHEFEIALGIFKSILEANPENASAKEGFTKAYAGLLEIQKTGLSADADLQKKLAALGQVKKALENLRFAAVLRRQNLHDQKRTLRSEQT
jgi:tetratricopeptide (TPR) repeat protein